MMFIDSPSAGYKATVGVHARGESRPRIFGPSTAPYGSET